MNALHLAHLCLVAGWGGVVAAEFIIELTLAGEVATRLHYSVDLLVEAPLLAAILGTGFALVAQAGPFTSLLAVKVASGLIAVLSAATCVVFVILRERSLGSGGAVAGYSHLIKLTGAGLPFGLLAAYIGLAYYT